MMEDDGGAPEDDGVVGVGELGDGRMFEEDCAAERGEGGFGEVDDGISGAMSRRRS
jgi:hypothetical protein